MREGVSLTRVIVGVWDYKNSQWFLSRPPIRVEMNWEALLPDSTVYVVELNDV